MGTWGPCLFVRRICFYVQARRSDGNDQCGPLMYAGLAGLVWSSLGDHGRLIAIDTTGAASVAAFTGPGQYATLRPCPYIQRA
jgi:hypothetical protein